MTFVPLDRSMICHDCQGQFGLFEVEDGRVVARTLACPGCGGESFSPLQAWIGSVSV